MDNNNNAGIPQQPQDRQPIQPPQGQQNVQYALPVIMQPTVNVDVKAYRLATASLFIGIIGLFFFWAPVIPIALAIISLVLSGKARKVLPIGAPGRSMATAAMVISIISIVLGSISLLIFIGNYSNVPPVDDDYYEW